MRGHCCAAAIAAVLMTGGACAQVLEVHVDGGVVTYDGATQHMSRGAIPTARLLTPAVYHPRRGRGRAGVRPMPAPPQATAEAIHAAAQRHQVDERLVTAVAWRESGFNPRAVSSKGARGTMQLMPGTARRLGVDADDPEGNIDGGTQYLSSMMRRFGGDQAKALAAYNAGPGAVERYGGVPPYAETKAYVDSILGRLGAGSEGALIETATVLRTRMAAF
jgi:hypothetical protein